jgi:UDP-N-acetylmuramyl pentapeptide phosphotransferase/UDP-N-acetylglucosamine-1-phosphate transferase
MTTPFILILAVVTSVMVATFSHVLIARASDPDANQRGLLDILDHPNERSLHAHPVPRTGGLAIWGGWMIAVLLPGTVSAVYVPAAPPPGTLWGLALYGPEMHGILPGLLIAMGISFLDDWRGLPAWLRLLAHGLAAACVIGYGNIVLPWGILGLLITLPGMIWMMNLYNFMDGMDGFAAGMAVAGFGTYALFGWYAHHPAFMTLSLLLASATLGFLVVNFPPARMFMGDVGSIPLGFMAGTLSVWGIRDGVFPVWVPVLVFAPFIVDATITLLRRIQRREAIWQAHRTHYYQRIVTRLGWDHRRTVLAEYMLMAGTSSSALLVHRLLPAPAGWILVALWAVIFRQLMRWVDRRETEP